MLAARSLIFAALVAGLPAAAIHAAESKPPRTAAPLQAALEKGGARLSLAVPDVAKLRIEDAQHDAKPGTPLRYGLVQSARLDALAKSGAGRWGQLPDGRSSWRLEVTGKGATSLEFGFSRFRLPHGAVLTIRSADGGQALAPLTDADNPAGGGPLHTAMLQADAAVLELTLPADKREYLQLELDSASYGYRDPFAAARAKSGSCNIDTACPEGGDWHDQIASTAHYTFISGSSTYVCTGTLMDTGAAAEDAARPRLSTAHHCISTASEATSMVLYWGYESPTCRTPGSGASGSPLPRNNNSRAIQTGGTTLVATHRATDFTALELRSPIPESALVYYSGWDRSGVAPQGSVGIHHPSGHEKRISFNDDPLTTMQNCIISGTDAATHWRVDDWELGTTEQGSSGSGLWNPANGLLVGVLTGGSASCTNPSGYDCYGRLSAAWEASGTTGGGTIRSAFDRSGTNPQTMPGKGTCNAPVVTLSSSAFTTTPQAGTNIELRATASGGTGDYTFEWDVDGDGVFERSGGGTVTVSFPTRRSVNVRVQARDGSGCPGSATRALDIAAPVIEVASVGVPAQVCGNGNGRVDPGERYTVPVTLRNTGTVPLAAGARALFAPASSLSGNGRSNAYGYEGGSQCGYAFIDIAQGAHAVAPLETYVANGNTYGPLDDARSSTIVLGGGGFPLYGATYAQAVMSTNGYVSFDPEESGGDYEGYCDGELALGSKGPLLRPHHDDMKVRDAAGAGLRYRWFASCPRTAASGLAQGCHVFQWSGMGYYVSPTETQGNFEFQAVAYATTGEVAYQYRSAAPDDGNEANIGLIGVQGADPLNLACESFNQPAKAQSALCIHSPAAFDAAPASLRFESPTLSLPSLAAGATATVNLPVQIRNDAACGTPLRFDYVATAAAESHSAEASSHSAGTVDAACQVVASCPAQVPGIDTRDGNYYNPRRSGNGFNSYVFGGNWYTAAADHTPTWYTATGGYVDNLLSAPLLHVTNQATPPALAVLRTQVGRLRLARIDATHALMAWQFGDGRAGAELIQLTTAGLPRANPDRTQHWYPPSQSGWGLDVESVVLDQRRFDSVLAYFYDTQGTPRWVLSDGFIDDGLLDLNSYRPHCPGCPRYADWQSLTQDAGQLLLRWSGDANATISTDITLPAPLQGQWQRSDVPLIRIGEIRP